MKIALAKGRLGQEALKKFQAVGIGKDIDLASRKLVFKVQGYEFLLLKPSDVMVYVKNGIADIGVVGSDVMVESEYGVYELLDMGFAKCKFSVAAPKQKKDVMSNRYLRVATKYPNVTKKYFKDKSLEIIPLKGSVELAPVAGLADCIVDIVETGKTLKANDLEIIQDLEEVSARLICNQSSYWFYRKEIVTIVEDLNNAKKLS